MESLFFEHPNFLSLYFSSKPNVELAAKKANEKNLYLFFLIF